MPNSGNIATLSGNLLTDSGIDLSTKADLVGGLIPSSQLPSYVDDVLEFANLAGFPATGETGKIYVALDTNETYRWSGSAFIRIANGAVQSVNSLTGNVTLTTSNIAEGTNLYYTDGRARNALSASGSLNYSASTGQFSYTTPNSDGISEGSSNLYFTNARARAAISVSGSLSYNATTGVISYTQPTNISTFTNDAAYITTAGARNAISVSGSLSYNATTGVISYTQPTTVSTFTNDAGYITLAQARAGISVAGSLSYNSTTGVISYTQPTNVSAFTNDSGYITTAGARSAISVAGSLSYNSSTGVISYTQPANISAFSNDSGYVTAAGARAALSFAAGSGGYNSSTGVITIPTNTNQLTNGAGFITSSGSITGSAGSVAWSGVSGKPTTLSGYGIIDAVYTTTGEFTTSGTGWYRVATTSSDGRGTYYIELYTTGGNHNPALLKIYAHGDWGSDKIVSVETDGGFPAGAVRITRGASNTFLEVNFTTTILGAGLRVTRLGFDQSIQIYTGSLPAGGNTVQDTVTLYGKGYATSGSVTASIFYDINDSNYYIDPNGLSSQSSLLIGRSGTTHSYDGGATGKIYFGSSGSDSPTYYHITTNLENYNGNYSKLDFVWYTGQRFYAHTGYGGFRFREITGGQPVLFSIGEGDSNVRVTNTLFIGGNTAVHAGNIQSYALQPIYGDSGAFNLNVSGQHAYIRYSTGAWVNSPISGNFSHVLSFNMAGDNRTVQMYLGDIPGAIYWRPSQGNATGFHPWERIWTSNSLTNLNQLVNGPGYITSYTETDTLASVTGRGASTSTAVTFSGTAVISTGLAWNAATPALNVGGSGDARIQVRHIWGKQAGNASTDHLWLQYANTGNHVQIGESGGGNNLYVSGDIYMNGYFAGSLVATRSWVSSQGYLTSALSTDTDSEQTVGARYFNWNEGPRRMNTDPRWNESGYDTDLGCLHIWAWTAGGAAYGRAGIALYNGSAYQYLTTKASTTGMFINNTQVVINSGTWNINVTGNSATTSQTNFSTLTVNNKHVRDSNYRTYSGYSDYYGGGTAGWYKVAEITLTGNCSGAVIYGTLYDHRYDGADTYQIAVVARADCDFTSNNESHYINVGCTILGSTNYSDYRSKIRLVLSASSSGSRTYELQFYESPWNHDTWQLETTGWTIYTSPQAASGGTGTPRVNYISNQSADYQRANIAMYAPIYYDSGDTAFYLNGNTNGGWRVGTASGYLDFGPLNSGFCHFQTDRPKFYFDRRVDVDGELWRYNGSRFVENNGGTWSISISGNAATASTASNSSALNGLSVTQIFNNMGQSHGTRTSFDASTPSYDFGFRYIQGSGNGPGTGGQYYSWYIGLGSDYPATGGGSYGAYFALNRTSVGGGNPYLSVRYNENNSLSGWTKIYAGYADVTPLVNAPTYNQPAVRVNSSGTGSAGSSIAIQQITAEGWTGVFVDFEPNTGWGLYHDNPNNYFCVTAELSTGSLRSFTVPSRESGNRTAHEKIRFDQNNGSILAGGDITAFSDGRVKTDIKVVDDPIEKIKKIRGVTFLKTTSEGEDRNKRHAGVIAQEVLNVLPEVVNKDKDTDMYNVAYGNMAALFIEAIKEQQTQIESQKTEIEELKDLVKQLINK